ncbi:MAG: PAS domain S-box protein, partial [Methanosarcinaceae archaeon]|nr:PAS domain S-box protein [Methanosarcinaceae archaeon]
EEICACPVFRKFWVGMALVSIAGKLLGVNPTLCKISGYSEPELLGQDFYQTLFPEKPNSDFELFKETTHNPDGTLHFENCCVQKDGPPIWTRVLAFPVRDRENRILYFVFQVENIDEQKKALLEFEASRKKITAIFENIDTGFTINEIGGCFLEVNGKTCDFLGYSRDELLRMSPYDIVPPETGACFSGFSKELMQRKRIVSEGSVLNRGGRRIPAEFSLQLIEYGGKKAVLCVTRDLSERKIAEKARRESENKFRVLFENASDGISLHDLNGRFFEVNRVVCEQTGYSREELLRMSPENIDKDKYIAKEKIEEILRKGHAVFEAEAVRKDGNIVPLEINSRIIEYGGKKALLSVSRDITERKKADAALREKVQFLKTLLNTIPAPVYYKDLNGKYQDFNELFASKVIGLPKEEILGHSVEEFSEAIPEDLASFYRQMDIELFERGGSQFYEGKIICSNRKERDFFFSKATYEDASGNMAGLVGVMLDITDLRQAEVTLREKLQFLNTLLDTIPTPVFFKDIEGRYQGCNELFASRIIGLPKEEIIERTVHEFPAIIPNKFASFYEEMDIKLLEGGGTQVYEGVVRCADGRERNFFFSKAVYEDASGKMAGLVGVMLDITERKQVEEDLQIKNTAVESSISGIAFADLKGKLTYANPSFLKLWGYGDKNDVLGKSSSCLWEDLKKAKITYSKLYLKGHWEGDLLARKKDGTLFDVYLSTNLLRDKKGDAIGIMGSFNDITRRKKTEDALLEAKLNAEAANRAKSEFLATMSHELRTPLNAVIGFSDLLLSQNFGTLNERQLKYADNISKSGKHLLKLINDILDLSKVEAGMAELDCEVFSISDAIDEVKTMLMPRSSLKNISIIPRFSPKSAILRADRTRFKQILYNLVGNALKFTPEGGTISISASVSGKLALISVEDHGIGIPETELQNIFLPFVQLEKFESREQAGAGLGLALVKRFVEMHGGEVKVKSEPGKGSIFTFTIPVVDG